MQIRSGSDKSECGESDDNNFLLHVDFPFNKLVFLSMNNFPLSQDFCVLVTSEKTDSSRAFHLLVYGCNQTETASNLKLSLPEELRSIGKNDDCRFTENYCEIQPILKRFGQ